MELETCMSREPLHVTSRVAMRMLGETINEFFDTLSWKSIVGMSLGGLIMIVGSELLMRRLNIQQKTSL